jgi:uncharacterized membrane protein YgdD (TMEM256/DUF423 family)
MYKQAMTAGALFAAIAVILGAFGAHALKAIMHPEQLMIFETGVRYQFYHSFALLIAGIAYLSFPSKHLKQASSFFIIGILLFSGSLYAMTLLSTQGVSLGPVGIITPIGGLFLIVGWILLLLGITKKTA